MEFLLVLSWPGSTALTPSREKAAFRSRRQGFPRGQVSFALAPRNHEAVEPERPASVPDVRG